jgi:hypothetical protein
MPPLNLPGQIFYANELSLPGGNRFLFKYEAFELCCALKPYAMRHVFNHYAASHLAYLDSDILVTHCFWQELESAWMAKAILLTPHLIRLPLELDMDFQRSLVQHGGYNGGFIAVKRDPDTEEFLDWWDAVLENGCTFDPMNNIYVDQRWLDLFASSSSAVGVLRDPGFNVAYWNLHERKLEEKPSGIWYVNDQPLRFFHLSGFHRERLTTKIICPYPMGIKIASHYGSLLDKAGEEEFGRFPYGWACYSNGDPILTSHRDLVLSNHQQLLGVDDPFSLPEKPEAWEKLQQLAQVEQPARISRRYALFEEALIDSQKRFLDSQMQLSVTNSALQRLYQHPVIGTVLKLWCRYFNRSLESILPPHD